MSLVKSSEQGSSLFLIQPGVDAPPPPAISVNMSCFSSSIYCVWKHPRMLALHPDEPEPVRAKSCMHGAGSASPNSLYQKAPSILRQLGVNWRKQAQAGRQVSGATELQRRTSSSIQPGLSQAYPPACVCAAACFSRLCRATSEMETGPGPEEKPLCSGEGMLPVLLIILLLSLHAL